MKVLVMGATGRVGSEVVKALLHRGADLRALTRKQRKPGAFPDAVEIALGDPNLPGDNTGKISFAGAVDSRRGRSRNHASDTPPNTSVMSVTDLWTLVNGTRLICRKRITREEHMKTMLQETLARIGTVFHSISAQDTAANALPRPRGAKDSA